ncbi:MAG: hypothetical protein GY877_00555 [Hyphomicrobium sp.]|nr:hypothetical protein [Hyphomicrobium sp.]
MALLALWVPAARRQARLRCWSAAFAEAFALPSGRLATPWTQLGRQVAAIRSRITIRRML